ncbi:MAG: tyrosine-type recombinase/integrase [Methylotenera sp.]|nr:tyrosine-type recombinase/integrase [Methylotenera sp.]
MKQNTNDNVFRRYLTLEEQRRLLATIKKHSGMTAQRDHALFTLLISSGLRIGECLKISCGAAADSLRCGRLFIPKDHRKGHSKGTAIDHAVYLSCSVRKALDSLLSLREGAELSEALIVSRNDTGKAMTTRAVEMRVSYWALQANLPSGVSPHWFRHSHAKNIIRESEAADPMRIAQIALGHSDYRSTQIYTQVDREEMASAMDNVDSAVHGKPRVRISHLRQQYDRRVAA